jgi:hypothetical protein
MLRASLFINTLFGIRVAKMEGPRHASVLYVLILAKTRSVEMHAFLLVYRSSLNCWALLI